MAVQIANHQHCWICGRAMEWDGENKTCSPECKAKLDARNRKRKNYTMLLYGLMAASVAYLVLTLVARPG